jgi:NAD(P)-dependent dehydrogenase (short-subunit alcohol dehydrogenase family)
MLPSFRLDGRVALVTGAGRGIGRGIALGLAAAGATVAVWDIDDGAATTVAQELGEPSFADGVDVADPAAVEAGLDRLGSVVGPVDVLVANAGVTTRSPVESLADEDLRRVIDVNLGVTFFCARGVGRRLIERGLAGSIVTVASISGVVGNRGGDNTHYCMTKGGVIAFTRSLAVEWARHRIRVNSIAPGYTATPMTDRLRGSDPGWFDEVIGRVPLQRLGTPEDMAGAAVFLASPAADYVTGHVLLVDGGYTAW